jgi:hypothetical protein
MYACWFWISKFLGCYNSVRFSWFLSVCWELICILFYQVSCWLNLCFKISLLIVEEDRNYDISVFVVPYLLWLLLLLLVGNGEKCAIISRGSREESVPRLIIVKLSSTGWSTPVVFPPHLEEVFHVNPCITCALWLCQYFCCIYWLKLSSSYSHRLVLVELGCASRPACHNRASGKSIGPAKHGKKLNRLRPSH